MGRTETWGSLYSGEAPGAGVPAGPEAQAGFQQAAHAEAELGMVSRVTLQKSWEGCFRQREQHGQSTEACHATAGSTGEAQRRAGSQEGEWKGELDRRAVGLSCCTGLAAPHCPLDTAQPSPQVLAAGIEANIPVTYGIGSQRGDNSTGCQFIGQSPVHSVSAAC